MSTPRLGGPAKVVASDYVAPRLPEDLPDAYCEGDIATVPLVEEPHRVSWQPEIPERYLSMPADELADRIRGVRAALGERLLILGHHYQRDDVIRFTDIRGDSFKLAREAADRPEADFILFCGVHFMAESADILTRPDQAVMLPNLAAGCSMADMAQPQDVYASWDELTSVVDAERTIPITYMNSAASLKAFVGRNGGAVCTSSNAPAVLRWAFERGDRVLFFPDQHLGRNTGKRLGIDPRSEMALWNPARPMGGLEAGRSEQPRPALAGPLLGARALQGRADRAGAGAAPRLPRRGAPGVHRGRRRCRRRRRLDGVHHPLRQGRAARRLRRGHRDQPRAPAQRRVQAEGKTAFCLDPVVCPCATMYRIHPAYQAWVLEELIAGRIVNQIRVDDDTRAWAQVALRRMLEIT